MGGGRGFHANRLNCSRISFEMSANRFICSHLMHPVGLSVCVCVVRPLLVGAENLLPDHPVPVAGQPRMPASDGVLYL